MSSEFCADGFLNQSLLTNIQYPIFTQCFQCSMLLIPTLIFIPLFTWFTVFKMYSNKEIIKISFDIWFILKLSLQLCLLIFLVIEILLDNILFDSNRDDKISILSYVCLCLTLCLVILQTEIRRRTMHPSCPILFLFWLSGSLAYVIRFYSNVIELIHNDGTNIGLVFVSTVILWLFLMSFICECWGRSSKDRLITKKKLPCPEEYASIMSKITYSWLDKYIYIWFKEEMTDEMAFDLRPVDEAKRNINTVENLFLEKINYRNQNQGYYQLFNNDNENILPKGSNTTNPGLILFICLVKTYSSQLLAALMFRMFHVGLIFTTPFLMRYVLAYVNDQTYPGWIGYALAIIFLLVVIINTWCENLTFFITNCVCMRFRAALVGMIFRKTMKAGKEMRDNFSSGDIVNLMSVDTDRISNLIEFSWFIFSLPVEIIGASILLYREIHYGIFAGIGVILAFFPINGLLIKLMQKSSEVELTWKDKRVKLLAEILNGIKVLKMYAWEKTFLEKVTQLRNIEMKYISRGIFAWSSFCVLWDLLPFLVVFVSFTTYIFIDASNVITAERAFVSLTLFNLLRAPMLELPWCFTNSINAFVSLRRIGRFLMAEELDTKSVEYISEPSCPQSSEENAITINDGSFAWRKEDKIILNRINLEIPRGKLVAIVGKVGTGKSSLISAMLGEMHKLSGSVQIEGTMAYVPQEAWIQNISLRNNILFTKSYDEAYYNQVIEACSLTSDLEQLPAGDETEIGERGINLSGGQKQRVSLARAIYQKRDIYLLDDPLSAVDAHVGQHLFEHVISNKGILNGKTRILVTHGLNWLPMVDEVFVLDSNGTISERGSFKELVSNGDVLKKLVHEYLIHINRDKEITADAQNGLVSTNHYSKQLAEDGNTLEYKERFFSNNADNINDYGSTSKSNDESLSNSLRFDAIKAIDKKSNQKDKSYNKSNTLNEDDKGIPQKPCGQFMDEEALSGQVDWRAYYLYIKSRGSILFIVIALIYALYAALQVFANIWLQKFAEDKIIHNFSSQMNRNSSNNSDASSIIRERTMYYLEWYAVIGISMIIVVSVHFIGYTICSIKASKIIHRNLLNAILHCSMEFFDTTPSGRIINRFNKDCENIDHTLPWNISDVLNTFFIVFSSLVLIVYVTPWFAIIILPLAVLYFFIQYLYMPSSRQSRRLDSITASPVFNNFTETIQGVTVIRAFREEKYFQCLNEKLIDKNNKFKFIQFCSDRWLSFRIDLIGNILVFGAVLFAVIGRDYLTAGLAGLSISYALQITDALNWFVRRYTNLEINCVGMERIRGYLMLPSEAQWDLDNNLPENWPDKGRVNFHNYDLRYREGLPLVLKSINLQLTGGENIGIVGRTGAGKSSLSLALFRLVEAAGGEITIDGVDICKLGLHDLRRKLTILPQEPLIFSGTIRENLDPFNNHTEDELFQSLETAHLKQWISTLIEGIEYECGEGGANLSVGQKQLLCLARALLRKSKVLILDEATASVDVETDKFVMETIKNYFRQSTVIIIAHRINTIIDTDKIVVMDQGQIVEMDSPRKLLEISDGIFKSLYDQSLRTDL